MTHVYISCSVKAVAGEISLSNVFLQDSLCTQAVINIKTILCDHFSVPLSAFLGPTEFPSRYLRAAESFDLRLCPIINPRDMKGGAESLRRLEGGRPPSLSVSLSLPFVFTASTDHTLLK